MHDYSTSRGRSCKLLQMTIGGYKCYTWVTRCGQPCCLDVVWRSLNFATWVSVA